MFIPSESIYAHIYTNHFSLVNFALQENVILASPTTLHAIFSNIKLTCTIVKHTNDAKEIREDLKKIGNDFRLLDEG